MTSPVIMWRRAKELHKYLGKKGKIVLWTKLYVAPKGYEEHVPYVVAIVEFGKGDRQTLPVVDCDSEKLQVGQEVITAIRRTGSVSSTDVIMYGVKVKPL
jgi:uncharacterized OB-fold protein